MPSERTFLFLQGIATPFFRRLARELRRRGHGVLRINLCLGDRLFWNGPGATNYRGSRADWPAYLAKYLREERITDVVLFGDCRPYHRDAIAAAQPLGLRLHVFEEGYIRPDWITIEPGPANAASCLPRDADEIRRRAALLPSRFPAEPIAGSFITRAFWDICANVATEIGRAFYPGYRRHRPHHPFLEYAAWVKRLVLAKRRKRAAQDCIERLTNRPQTLYLLPLQLDSDYQIRVHSPFSSMSAVTKHVIASFAKHAPGGSHLIVKLHPLDNGLANRKKITMRIAEEHGIAARVHFMDGGHMPTLLPCIRGVVLVNSTVGTQAISYGVPVKTLGAALYDVPGLTFQGELDDFWEKSARPDAALAEAFRRVMVAETQVNGGFYSRPGIRVGVEKTLERMGLSRESAVVEEPSVQIPEPFSVPAE